MSMADILDFLNVFFLGRDTYQVLLDLFVLGGWVILDCLLLKGLVYTFLHYRQHLTTKNWKWVLLAIDIPALNVQTPKAVEQMFSHLAGCLNKPNIYEAFYEGFKQRWFSLEIISIEGYIQFLVRTEEALRDLVEASIYAQYPDAEIIEVEDYVSVAPTRYPNDEYEVWAADFGLAENAALPIRSYTEFEHAISKDTVLKDPMGTFLESFTRLGPGEQMWFQILIEPVGNEWKEKAIEYIKEYIGEEKSGGGGGLFSPLKKELGLSTGELMSQILGGPAGGAEHAAEAKKEPNKIRYMTPGQKKIIEAMENKIAKIGFKTKIRGVYLARKEVFNLNRGVRALVGALSQYNIPSCNSIVPKWTVFAFYFLKKMRMTYRKLVLVSAYKKRKIKAGITPYVLNIEELATIWHFPMSHVKTPMVQKASLKTTEPPAGLPVETIFSSADFASPEQEKAEKKEVKGYKTDSGEMVGDSDQLFG